jgi:PAS domain S-box-containing protein
LKKYRDLSLRMKALLPISLIFVALAVVVFLVLNGTLLRHFDREENLTVARDLRRAVNSLERKESEVGVLADEWGAWDDTYEFILDGNPSYIQSNLTDQVFESMRLNLALYVNRDGQAMFEKYYDDQNGASAPVPQTILGHIKPGDPLLDFGVEAESLQGLIASPTGYMLIASHPILTTGEKGPSRGALILGRNLDALELEDVAKMSQLKVTLNPFNGTAQPPDLTGARKSLAAGKNVVMPKTDKLIAGYALVKDIYRKPALILGIEEARTAHLNGQAFARYMIVSLLALVGFFAIAILLLMDRIVLTPLARLSSSISEIGKEGSLSSRVHVSGNDELARLAGATNETLASLERSQEHLTRSEEKYRELVENAQSIIIRVDTLGNITFFNEFARGFFGYRAEEILGKNVVGTIVPERDYQGVDLASLLHDLMTNPTKNVSHENENVRRSGERVWIYWTFKPILDSEGEVIEILCVGTDITERKMAEDKISRQRALLVAINSIFTVVISHQTVHEMAKTCLEVAQELTGSRFGFICEVNEKGLLDTLAISDQGWEACRMPREEAELALIDLEASGIRGKVIKDGRSLIVNQPASHHDFIQPPEGHPSITSFLGVPLTRGERVIGMIALANRPLGYELENQEDLESLSFAFMEALKRIRAEQELEERGERLRDFFSVASHELRHPIAVIKGYALTLINYMDRMPKESLIEALSDIDLASDRLTHYVEELLDVSRIEGSRFPIERREITPEVLIEIALGDMKAIGCENELRVKIQDGVGQLDVDPERFVQLMIILLDNAVRYSTDSLPIDIEVARGDGETIVSVLDRGPGIPDDSREMVFDQFFQVADSLHHSEPGLGLGLYIARKIVKGHGGRIWYEPRSGGGSAFHFTIT